MKKIRSLLIILGIMFSICLASVPLTTKAIDADLYKACTSGSTSEVCAHKNDNINTYIKSGINILLFILGAVAVVMIIFSGILYTTSGGNTGTVTKAKDTLLYSVVGLVVAICAYAIVNFVLMNFK